MKIGIIGLGYVGLPLAIGFARSLPGTVGFDINARKVEELRSGLDRTGEVPADALVGCPLHMTSNPEDLRACTIFVVAVPTPIDAWNRPDLSPVIKASELIGRYLKPSDIVVYESTVFPGVTEDICGPILERVSGLPRKAFRLGYSPERINPGDKEHTLERIVKVVSGEDDATLDTLARIYGAVVHAGIHRAPSIKVAETAKVIENTQRDINIALMNELATICEKLDIRTCDVLSAARTKWNFLPFSPGLVGGHCIGVDPYYLTTKAEELGYHAEVILAGRRINDGMGPYIAQKLVKLLIQEGIQVKGARVALLGLTFKENVTDLRNSKVPDIAKELAQFGIAPLVSDPMAEAAEAYEEYGIELVDQGALVDLDAAILAVPHAQFLALPPSDLTKGLRRPSVFVDVKSALAPGEIPDGIRYWSL